MSRSPTLVFRVLCLVLAVLPNGYMPLGEGAPRGRRAPHSKRSATHSRNPTAFARASPTPEVQAVRKATDPSHIRALRALRDAAQASGSLVSDWDFSSDPCGLPSCRSIPIRVGWARDLQTQLRAYPPQPPPPQTVVVGENTSSDSFAPDEESRAVGAEGPPQQQSLPTCAFAGISCEGWSITEVLLPGQQLLLPSIPVELSALNSLRALDLSDNGVGGRLSPFLLSRLPSQLAGLNLARNHLTGGLPSAVSKLTGLRVLNLAANEFEGGVPRLWASLRQLALLDLSRNRLFGPLPEDLDALADNIRVLRLSDNCGLCGAGTSYSTKELFTAVETLDIVGTHLRDSCSSPNIQCPRPVTGGHLTLGVQIIAIAVFILLACVLICIVCSYFRYPSLLRLRGARRRRNRPPPRGSAPDSNILTHFVTGIRDAGNPLEMVSTAPAIVPTSEADKPRKSQPIGAVIINPGSTVLAPNLCVAFALGLDDESKNDTEIARDCAVGHAQSTLSSSVPLPFFANNVEVEYADALHTSMPSSPVPAAIIGAFEGVPPHMQHGSHSAHTTPPEPNSVFRRVRRLFSRQAPLLTPRETSGVILTPASPALEASISTDGFLRVDTLQPGPPISDTPPQSTPRNAAGGIVDSNPSNIEMSIMM